MYRLLILVFMLCAPLAWAQEAEDTDTGTPEAAESADEVTADADEDLDELDDLDELYPVEDDDEFIPSEDVAFGQSIPFPTDI